MLKSILYCSVAIAAVLWLPWVASMLLLVFGIVVLQFPFVLVVPAIVSDYLFAPHTAHSIWSIFHNHIVFLIVAALLIVRYSILAKTRVQLIYS